VRFLRFAGILAHWVRDVLQSLLSTLDGDPFRKKRPFSADLITAHQVLLNPHSKPNELNESLRLWLRYKQPCLFGRMAAEDGLFICFLTDKDLRKSDSHVRHTIRDARRRWRRRAWRGGKESGFLLAVLSSEIAFANPDRELQKLAHHIQDLAGWPARDDVEGNQIVDEWVYLQNPKTKSSVKFTFSVDFFASGGDGRWWHDHRIPGGLAFTANSLGHMVRRREWYDKKTDGVEWALRNAMNTILQASVTEHGPATWLIDVGPAGPFKDYTWSEASPPAETMRLKGKDPGSYLGALHTDHALRQEFFDGSDSPLRKREPWAMDFTYIFDEHSDDYSLFIAGVPVSDAEVEADLGNPREWRFASTLAEQLTHHPRPKFIATKIEKAIQECRKWALTDSH
jgi:hypothetical protein